jgi:hypothetical protein
MNNHEPENNLKEDKNIDYSDIGLIDICDLCNNYYSIYNEHDNGNYISYEGKQFLCIKCKSD